MQDKVSAGEKNKKLIYGLFYKIPQFFIAQVHRIKL
jgi:hypothetical protein